MLFLPLPIFVFACRYDFFLTDYSSGQQTHQNNKYNNKDDYDEMDYDDYAIENNPAKIP